MAAPTDDARVVASRYAHVVRLKSGSYLCVNALSRTRLVVRSAVADIVRRLRRPRRLGDFLREQALAMGVEEGMVRSAVSSLIDEDILYCGTHAEEKRERDEWLASLFDRDPEASLGRWQRATQRDQHPAWAAAVPRTLESFAPLSHHLRVIVLGACEVQMELDLMREEARNYDVLLSAVATFQHDVDLVAERPHDFVVIGALAERYPMLERHATDGDAPHQVYVDAARRLVERLRASTRAPILIDNLPTPTCSALGLAERGRTAHRERCRQASLGLLDVAASFEDVYVVDVDAALARHGTLRLLDDSVCSFSHLGSLRWIEQRPAADRRAVHGIFPPLEKLDALGAADTYEHERILAREHVGMMIALKGLGRRKCVVIDLDGTLWPGVLADTESPFAWTPDLSGAFSFVGLYFGIHEALKALASRGILLACVSKNDESVVRKLWTYGPEYPTERLLTLDDFVAYRINWQEKVDNLRALSEELNIGLDAMVFVDDNPVEREKVARYLPSVMVLGDNPFVLRRQLLTSPYLQVPTVTAEARGRAEMVKAQMAREHERRSAVNASEFLPSLGLTCEIARLGIGDDLDRAHELVLRTNQFNTTARRYGRHELDAAVARPDGRVYTLRVADRFADYGLVGVCVVEGPNIALVVVSCRVLGLGVEDVFLRSVLRDLQSVHAAVEGRIAPSDRNLPCRNLFRNNGFTEVGEHGWRLDLRAAPIAAIPSYYAVSTRWIPSPEVRP
jgi:FkbH-like protein